jgi:hypothetical protein
MLGGPIGVVAGAATTAVEWKGQKKAEKQYRDLAGIGDATETHAGSINTFKNAAQARTKRLKKRKRIKKYGAGLSTLGATAGLSGAVLKGCGFLALAGTMGVVAASIGGVALLIGLGLGAYKFHRKTHEKSPDSRVRRRQKTGTKQQRLAERRQMISNFLTAAESGQAGLDNSKIHDIIRALDLTPAKVFAERGGGQLNRLDGAEELILNRIKTW